MLSSFGRSCMEARVLSSFLHIAARTCVFVVVLSYLSLTIFSLGCFAFPVSWQQALSATLSHNALRVCVDQILSLAARVLSYRLTLLVGAVILWVLDRSFGSVDHPYQSSAIERLPRQPSSSSGYSYPHPNNGYVDFSSQPGGSQGYVYQPMHQERVVYYTIDFINPPPQSAGNDDLPYPPGFAEAYSEALERACIEMFMMTLGLRPRRGAPGHRVCPHGHAIPENVNVEQEGSFELGGASTTQPANSTKKKSNKSKDKKKNRRR